MIYVILEDNRDCGLYILIMDNKYILMIDTIGYYSLGIVIGIVLIILYNNIKNRNVLPMTWRRKLDSIEIKESDILKDRY